MDDASWVLTILGVATLLFASGRVRLDITALLVVVALILTQVLSVREALSGFGDPIIVLIGGLFVVGDSLVRTGVAQSIGDAILKIGGGRESRLIILFMLAAALLGSIMSSTAVTAIFIPIVVGVAARASLNPARLLMPMCFAALISGMLTLIGTPSNLVVSAALEEAGYAGFRMFSFAPIGFAVLGIAIIYTLALSRRMLGPKRISAESKRAGSSIEDLIERYELTGIFKKLRIEPGSQLVGDPVIPARFRDIWGVDVFAVARRERFGIVIHPARPDTIMLEGDILLAGGDPEDLDHAIAEMGVRRLPIGPADRSRLIRVLGLIELLIPPDSQRIRMTSKEMQLRSRFGVTVLGIRRAGAVARGLVADKRLKAGDVLLVAGRWEDLDRLSSDPKDFVVLDRPAEIENVAPTRAQAPLAIAVMAAMILLLVTNWIPMVATVLLACLALVASRCMTMDQAYRAINWSIIILVAGLLPVADALDKTGVLENVANTISSVAEDYGPHALLTALFAFTAGLSTIMSNTATAVIMAPLAVKLAEQMEISPTPLAITVIMAASAAYSTPVASPVVTLAVTPGNYRFMDFVKVGVPLLVLTWLVTLLLTPLVYPF